MGRDGYVPSAHPDLRDGTDDHRVRPVSLPQDHQSSGSSRGTIRAGARDDHDPSGHTVKTKTSPPDLKIFFFFRQEEEEERWGGGDVYGSSVTVVERNSPSRYGRGEGQD